MVVLLAQERKTLLVARAGPLEVAIPILECGTKIAQAGAHSLVVAGCAKGRDTLFQWGSDFTVLALVHGDGTPVVQRPPAIAVIPQILEDPQALVGQGTRLFQRP